MKKWKKIKKKREKISDKMAEPEIAAVIEALMELRNEGSVPKNVKSKIDETIKALKEEGAISIRVNKALHELEEISEDTNMQPYTRTQLWNVVSMLEIV